MRCIKELIHCKKNFDAWAYNIYWPHTSNDIGRIRKINVVVEDIKFAYNAWCLLRLLMFYGLSHPSIISNLSNTVPSMCPKLLSNSIFYENAKINSGLSNKRMSIALTPNHPRGICIQQLDWNVIFSLAENRGHSGIEFVLGMENGLSKELSDKCDLHTFIPQYGSVGSLSMISALSIAVHLGSCGLRTPNKEDNLMMFPVHSHVPLSSNDSRGKGPPHESDLIGRDIPEIQQILEKRRLLYPLQLGFVIHNEMGDRNIGAIMRNADAYNCEKGIILCRKKFNRRGALGTHRIINIIYSQDVQSKECISALHGYEVWMLYPYYPYLHVYYPFGRIRKDHPPCLPVNDVDVENWMKYNHIPTEQHPLYKHYPHLLDNQIFLDDEESLISAVGELIDKKITGIILAIPEEGSTPHPSLVALSKKVVYQRHHSKIPLSIQRGLNGALSTAVAFERLRTTIDFFASKKS